jgi:hypothetical protein
MKKLFGDACAQRPFLTPVQLTRTPVYLVTKNRHAVVQWFCPSDSFDHIGLRSQGRARCIGGQSRSCSIQASEEALAQMVWVMHDLR